MNIRIQVTARDIREGQRNSNTQCPVCRAIGRRLNAQHYPVVSAGRLNLHQFGTRSPRPIASLVLPAYATRWVLRFDERLAIRPFSFEIDIPAEMLRLQTVRNTILSLGAACFAPV